jgi:DNA-binding HxlR family transcriptional regulator
MSLPGPLHENCPLRQMFDLIGDRWTSVVIFVLSQEVKRYSDLQRHIPGISKKMLTQTLRSLERDKLLTRKVYPVVPPKTEYQLTPLGLQLLEPITGLSEWAKRHESDLKAIYARRKKHLLAGE